MGDLNLEVAADLSDLVDQLSRVPELAEGQARAMVRAMEKRVKAATKAQQQANKQAADAARRSSEAAARAWSDAGSEIRGSLASVFPVLGDIEDRARSAAAIIGGGRGGAGLALAGGIGALTVAIGAATAAGADYIRTQDQLASRVGLTRDTVAGLTEAMRSSGRSIEDAEGALETISDKLVDAYRAGGEAAELFDALGVSIADAHGEMRRADDVLADVIDGLQRVDSDGAASGIAMQLLGDAGASVAATFRDTDRSLRDFTRTAREMGAVVSDESVEAVRRFDSAWSSLTTKFSIGAAAIGGPVLEGIEAFVSNAPYLLPAFIETAKGIETWQEATHRLRREAEGGRRETLDYTDAMLALGMVADDVTIHLARQTDQTREQSQATRALTVDIEGMTQQNIALAASLREVEQAQGGKGGNLQQRTAQTEAYADALGKASEMQAELAAAEAAALAANAGYIEAQREAYQTAAFDFVSSAGAMSGALSQLIVSHSEEMTAAQKRAATAAFYAQQALADVSIAMSTAQAIAAAQAVPGGPLSPAAILGTAAAVATGIAQAAVVHAQQPPVMHTGGMVTAPDETMIRAQSGEAVLSRQGVAAAGGREGIAALNRGGGGGGAVVVEQVYQHRALGVVIADHLQMRSTPLARATRAMYRPGHRE